MRTSTMLLPWIIATVMTVAIVLVSTTLSQAANRMCGNRSSLVEMLINKYNETPRALGLSSSNKLAMEIYVSEKGTWTVMMTTTSGITCIMAAGNSWQQVAITPSGPQT